MISGIEQFAFSGIYKTVNWITRLMAVMLAVLWLPVTVHCRIEMVSGLTFLACAEKADAHGPHQGQSCEGDPCSELESGFFKIEENSVVSLPSALVPGPTFSLCDLDDTVPHSVLVCPSPPDLPRSWQFTFRTALPPRAPSFVS